MLIPRCIATVIVLSSLTLLGCQADRREPVTICTKAPDGVNLCYSARGAGKPALVFIHGWCCNHQLWKNQLDEFANNHRVIAVDLAGHGASGTKRQNWCIEGLADDVVTVVKHANLDHVILVGHSMGGPISLIAAARMPRRVSGIIAVDTLHNVEFRFPPAMAKQMADAFQRDFDAQMAIAVRGMLAPDADPQLAQAIIDDGCLTHKPAAIALLRDFPNLELTTLLAAVNVPVRAINAAPISNRGMPTNVEINQAYADFDAHIMTGVGHYPMVEDPDAFNQHLRKVLRETDWHR